MQKKSKVRGSEANLVAFCLVSVTKDAANRHLTLCDRLPAKSCQNTKDTVKIEKCREEGKNLNGFDLRGEHKYN